MAMSWENFMADLASISVYEAEDDKEEIKPKQVDAWDIL